MNFDDKFAVTREDLDNDDDDNGSEHKPLTEVLSREGKLELSEHK